MDGSTTFPEDGGVVDANQFLGNVVSAAELVDSLATSRERVIIDDAETSARQLRIQVLQGIHGRSVHVAIQTQQGTPVDWGVGQGFVEPALQEMHSVVQKAVFFDIRLHLCQWYCEDVIQHPVNVADVGGIAGIGFG